MSTPITAPEVRWIWGKPAEGEIDAYRLFRTSFDLDEVPGSAAIQLAADSTFSLYVNGQRVPGSQFSDYPMERSYSTFDLTGLLKKGKNTVAVQVHYMGTTFYVYMPGLPSLRAAVFSGREIISATGKSVWKTITDPAFKGAGKKLTMQMGFYFEYDAEKALDWTAVDFDDSSWEDAFVYSDEQAPMTLAPRPVRQLEELPSLPSKILCTGFIRRENQDPEATPADLCFTDYFHPVIAPKMMDVDHILYDPVRNAEPKLFKDDDAEYWLFNKLPEGSDNGIMIIADLQQESCGYLKLRLKAAAGTVIDIAHGEHLTHGRVLSRVYTYNFADRYVCKEGINEFIYPHRRLGCRYIELHITNVTSPLEINYIGMTPVQLPLPAPAELKCEDGILNRLNELSIHTMKLCIHEHYEDCPWREQSLWNFDARIQMMLGYYVWGNYDFAAASLELMRQSCKKGWLAMTEPGDSALRRIPMFSLTYISALRERLLFGDFWDGMKKHLDTVDEIIDNVLSRKSGDLYELEQSDLYWNFYEWVGQLSALDEFPQSMWNIYVFEALQSAAYLHGAAGNEKRAEELIDKANALAKAIESTFREPEFYSVLLPGKHPHGYTLTQLLMIALKLAPRERVPVLWESIKSGKLLPTSPQNQIFEIEALMNCTPESREFYSKRVIEQFKPMLDYGATSLWETADSMDRFGSAASLCHAWSAIPVLYSGRFLLGVVPLEPGFTDFAVKIAPGHLTHASGEVPTPHGRIYVEWKMDDDKKLIVKVKAPAECRLIKQEYPEFPVKKWEIL